jgi:YggT family protein
MLGQIAWWAIEIVILALIARMFLDLWRVLNPRFRPRGLLVAVTEIVYTVTDFLIKPTRKLVPPIRIGNGAIDIAFTLVLLVLWALQPFCRLLP